MPFNGILKFFYFYFQGTGKTMVMDMFYAYVEMKRKKRVHFHGFMLDVHRSKSVTPKQPVAFQSDNDNGIFFSSDQICKSCKTIRLLLEVKFSWVSFALQYVENKTSS